MRVKVAGLLAMVLTASCAVQVGTDGGGGGGGSRSPQAARRAPPPPPPRPAAAPPPAPAPAPAQPRPAGLGKIITPAPAPAPAPTQNNAVNPDKLNALRASDVVNVARFLEISKRNPKNCGYVEVAPGNWTHIDCQRYQPSTRAVPHLTARKAKLIQQKKLMFLPVRKLKNPANFRVVPLKTPTPPTNGGKTPSFGSAGGSAGAGNPQVGEEFPGSVDHRAENLEGPIKNQGGVGSCTAHSLSSTLDNAAIRAGNLNPGDTNRMTSPMHVWSRYGLPNMGAAADGNIAQPVAVYTNWPQSDKEACMLFQAKGSYADDCAEAYGVKAGGWREDKALMAKYDKSQAEGIFKIASIEKLQTEPPNMDELLGILSSGADIWSAFLIDGRNWRNSAMTNAVIPDWGEAASGHAVVISGYRETPSGRQFLIHNSWGKSWGDDGYAWISEKMVVKNLYYAYKVKITNGVKKEDLTDDDCAPDELVDMGTGLCAVMCGDDSRPNNGCGTASGKK